LRSHHSTYDAIVIGGGVAGLSAAVELTNRGVKVLLLEHRPFLGGRTYSFIDETTGDVVDNGQHLLMGCYHETRRYLRLLGADHLASLQPVLRIDFLHPHRGEASLIASRLPSPLHVLTGLLCLRTLSFADRLRLLNVGKELLWTSHRKEQRLEALTVDQWLTSLGQSEANKKYLWDIIAIGSLNDDPKKVSALLFFRVLESAFMGSREDASLLIPRVGLSELLCDPAERFLRSNGGEVRKGCTVQEVVLEGSRVSGVHCDDGTTVNANAVVCAVPWYAMRALFRRPILPSDTQAQFVSSPIITVNLWLDRPIMEREFVALLDSRVQWVFNRSKILEQQRSEVGGRGSAGRRQYLSLVLSGAAEYVEMEKEWLIAAAMDDLRRAFPTASSATVIHALVIKEKRATFSPQPKVVSLRPSTRTPYDNLFLAGDWTDTGLPATIEGAVRSGRAAAEAVVSYLAC
jgi:squalene-associated FAD-dependent desaturase